jgi:hypothetical protein
MCELIHVVSAHAFWVCPTYVNVTNCSHEAPLEMLEPSSAPSPLASAPSPLEMLEPSFAPSPLEMLEPSFAPSPLQMLEPSSAPSPLQMLEPSSAPSPLEMLEPSSAPSPLQMSEPSSAPSPLQMSEPSSAPSPSSPYIATKYTLKTGLHAHNSTDSTNTTFNATTSNEPDVIPDSTVQNLDVLHVLWTIPITGLLLIFKTRSKSAQIKAGWQGRKMTRSQSCQGTPRRKSPISSRWKSEPLQVSDFDGINAIA